MVDTEAAVLDRADELSELFGLASYGFDDRCGFLAVGRSEGRDRAWRVDAAGTAGELPLPFDEIDFVALRGETALLMADSATDAGGLVEVDLATGRWDGRHAHLRTQAAFAGSLRLVTAPGRGHHHVP